ncbi:MAG: hypothetical protein D6737_20575 [Chloroflexi bacterium]|nr:MAG: hypothetical protein D6737_20575 [Chloroflexota bacterium]
MDLSTIPVIDPNLVYLVLIIGLWTAISAAYIPGTGIAEIAAFVTLGSGIILLTAHPVNWWAFIVLLIGVISFIAIPFISPERARYAESGLALQAIGSVFLIDELAVSWILVGFVIGMSLLYHRLVLLPILKKHRELPVIDMEADLIGAYGRVIKPLTPIGTVQVNGELWSARSETPLENGETVQVIKREGLHLLVESAKPKRELQTES